MFYLVVAIICTYISARLFHKASGTISLHSPNMMSIIFYFYLFLGNVIGAVLIVNNIDEHYIIGKLSSDIYRVYGFWIVMYTIMGFPFGQLLANKFLKKGKMSLIYEAYLNKPLTDEHIGRKRIKTALIILSFFCVLGVIYTLVTIGGSPLSRLMSSEYMDMVLMRAEAKRNFAGNEYLRNIFGVQLTPIMSYVAYGYWKCHNSRFNKMWMITMIIFSVLILTYDLEKSPLLWYGIGFLLYKVYMGYKLSTRTLLIVGGTMLCIVISIYVFLMEYDSTALFIFNQGFIGRLTLTSTAGLYISLDIFPRINPHLGFSSFSRWISLLFDLPYVERSARWIMEYTNPGAVDAGIAGVVNSLFVSEAWANWGLIGVIFSPIYVGFVIQCFYSFLLTHKKTPFFLALMVQYSVICGVNGGVNDYIYNASTIIMILVYLFVYNFGKKHYEKNYNPLPVQN